MLSKYSDLPLNKLLPIFSEIFAKNVFLTWSESLDF